MAGISKIPKNYEDEVMQFLGEGKTYTEVSQMLKERHNVDASYSQIVRYVTAIRKRRNKVANQIYADQIAKTAMSDMEIMSENIRILKETRDKAYQANQDTLTIKACAEIKSHISLKMSVMGVDNSADLDAAKEDLLDQIIKYKETQN